MGQSSMPGDNMPAPLQLGEYVDLTVHGRVACDRVMVSEGYHVEFLLFGLFLLLDLPFGHYHLINAVFQAGNLLQRGLLHFADSLAQ